MDVLRQRAGLSSTKRPARRSASPPSTSSKAVSSSTSVTLTDGSGHINFFAPPPAEHTAAVARLIEKAKDVPKDLGDKGTPLAPSSSDLRPWYTDAELRGGREREKVEKLGGIEERT